MNNQSKYFHHVEHRKFQSSSKATLWSSLIITLIFTIVEFVGGLYANSLALLSDSFHMLSDVLALGLSMLAIYFASKPPTNIIRMDFKIRNYCSFLKWFSINCYFVRYYVRRHFENHTS